LADRRIEHPHELVNVGDEITVRILDVDPDRRRIALSLRQADNWDE
jgi:ribosomal protein S1